MINTLRKIVTITSLIMVSSTHADTQRISLAHDGAQADRDSYQASISDNGEAVAYRSPATNLVPGDTNGSADIFVWEDHAVDTVERVSVQSNGNEYTADFNNSHYATSISDDGQKVAFEANRFSNGPGNIERIFVRDRSASTTTICFIAGSTSNDFSRKNPYLSGNGQFVAMRTSSSLTNAGPVNERPELPSTNRANNLFVRDMVTPPAPIPSPATDPLDYYVTEKVNVNIDDEQTDGDSFHPTMSDDGRFVAFYSYARNLTRMDDASTPNINEQFDTNDHEDIFIKDRDTEVIIFVSKNSGGEIGNDDSYNPMISGNSKFVAYRSIASNLVGGDTNGFWDIFVYDVDNETTERVSVSSTGAQANNHSFAASISDDGRYVVYRSNASNLVAGDTNQRYDIFLHDRVTHQTTRVSVSSTGEQANGHSYLPTIAGDTSTVIKIAFESDATNLVPGDTNSFKDIFLYTQ